MYHQLSIIYTRPPLPPPSPGGTWSILIDHLPVGAHGPGGAPAVSQRALPAGGVGHAGLPVVALRRAHPEPQNAVLGERPPRPAHLGGDWTAGRWIESACINGLIYSCLTSAADRQEDFGVQVCNCDLGTSRRAELSEPLAA